MQSSRGTQCKILHSKIECRVKCDMTGRMTSYEWCHMNERMTRRKHGRKCRLWEGG